MPVDYRIEKADNREKYEGLRTLWCEVFHDEPEFVDSMYEAFGDDIEGYVTMDGAGRVCSALTCFLSGELEGRPVYTSYAICTSPEHRGLGLAGELVEHVRDKVLAEGAVSLICPAEESLEEFYGGHGYIPYFYTSECHALIDDEELFDFDEEDEEYEKFEPEFIMTAAGTELYGRYREAYLGGRPHVEMTERMMNFVESECRGRLGLGGLYVINGGDAVCAVLEQEDGVPRIEELIMNPMLAEISAEIDEEIAGRIAKVFGMGAIIYRMPGPGGCQAMAAGLRTAEGNEDDADTADAYEGPAYYGFPAE